MIICVSSFVLELMLVLTLRFIIHQVHFLINAVLTFSSFHVHVQLFTAHYPLGKKQAQQSAFESQEANLLMYVQEPPRGDGASGSVQFLILQ